MIKITNLTKSFHAVPLFKDLNFILAPGNRIGLVGRNGSGKSTLFKIIMDEEHYDEGEITVSKGYTIGALKQHIEFSQPTVIAECAEVLSEEEQYNLYKIEKLLFGLGFSQSDLERDPMSFSGGYQIRINLVKLLATEPNLLLLDEPTNYLDIVSMRWLKGFLRTFEGEVILITHDREFMDAVTTHTMGIHRKGLKIIKGDTKKYYRQLIDDEIHYEKMRVNQEKKISELEDFIARNKSRASTAAMAQGKVKELEKIEVMEKLQGESDLSFKFTYRETPAKRLLEAKELGFGYDPDKPLFRDISFFLEKGKRIAIIGKNGKGKSTLLNYIAGELPKQSGECYYHPETAFAHFGQTNIERLSSSNTIIEEIQSVDLKLGFSSVRSICGTMMFGGELADKKISVLSGGERSRVMLGKIIATPANLLLLDEPTNHLDMQSIDSLCDAIEAFEGSLLMVTHSEMLLRRLADQLIIFHDNGAEFFDGDYESFLEKIGWEDQQYEESTKPKKESSSSTLSRKELKKQRSDLIVARGKVINPLKREIEQCETEIIRLEESVEQSNELLIDASQTGDIGEIQSLSKRIAKESSEIEILFEKLEDAQESFDEISQKYERELAVL
ncbi:MAG: ABC-F family ATP-binding cassette domain-containing protein [Campylobacterota bacterium]|nr:ABC-F family ATP-binding cassette domain-containing protein [Campylobacterota bacterium]